MKSLLRFGRIVSRKNGHKFNATFQPLNFMLSDHLYYSTYPHYYYSSDYSNIKKTLYRAKGRILYGALTRYKLSLLDQRARVNYKVRKEAYA